MCSDGGSRTEYADCQMQAPRRERSAPLTDTVQVGFAFKLV